MNLPLEDRIEAEWKERQHDELHTDIVRVLFRADRINSSARAIRAANEILALVREVYDDSTLE